MMCDDDAIRRIIRVDMRQLDSRVAEQLLEDYGRLLSAVVSRITSGWPLPNCLGYDDLMAVAQIAACEAYLTYRDDGRMTLSTWIYRVAQWRCAALIKQAFERMGPDVAYRISLDSERCSRRAETETYTLREVCKTEDPGPEEVVDQRHRREWVRSQIETVLDPREALALDGALKGMSTSSVARAIGLSRQRLNVHHQEGLDKLQRSRKRRERLSRPPLTAAATQR